MDESNIWYAEPFTVDHKLSSLPSCPMKPCRKLVSRQVPSRLLLPTGTWSSSISLTRRQEEAVCVCLCVYHRQMHIWASVPECWCIFIILCQSVYMCVCVCLSVRGSWQVRKRPSARCSVWKISSNPQAPLLRRWTGSEQVVICLSKYKHGWNNERGFIS